MKLICWGLVFLLLIIPLVSSEPLIGGWYWYYIGEDDYELFEIEYYNMNESVVFGNFSEYDSWKNSVDIKCMNILTYVNHSLLKKLRLIRVWDNHPKEGQPAGLYFLSNIIHIYDGCRNPDTLIHELAHLDRKSIVHDGFFWLSYYRIKWKDYQ